MTTPPDLLGALQIHVMRHVWTLGKGSARQIMVLRNDELHLQGYPPLAYTTYLTVLRNLARRRFLTQSHGATRAHMFTIAITKESYRQRVVAWALYHFEGDGIALMTQLRVIEECGLETYSTLPTDPVIEEICKNAHTL